MQKSNAPTVITVPFASGAGSGYRNTIPIPSQIPITPGAASWTDGFPPLTMTAPGAGGIPPYGQDMNGLGFALSTVNQWTQLGFVAAYSSSVSTAIGGYPAGACIGQLGGLGYWLSTADNNTTNPDATGAANWVAVRANAGRSTIAVAAGTVTPDPSVLGAPLLVLSGTLTANVTLVLPLTQPGAAWSIYNATTGAFTVNVQGATGSGVVAAQGSLTDVRTDGTNFYTSSLSGGPFLPLHGTADAAAKLATARTIAMTGDVSWTSAAFDGTANVTSAATIANGAVTLAKMATFAANSLMGNPTSATAAPVAIALTAPLQFASGNLGLSYTPVNKAGDTGIGNLTSTGTIQAASLIATGTVTADTNIQSSSANLVLGPTGAGNIFLRPNGTGSTTGQAQMQSNGTMTFANDVQAGQNFVATTNNAVLATTGAGTCYFRPNGTGSTTGQLSVDSDGNAIFSNQVNAPSFNATSDASFKSDVKRGIKARDLRAASLATWTWNDLQPLLAGKPGWGLVSQDLVDVAPEHVVARPDGKLGIEYARAALEQAYYASDQIDALWEAVRALQVRVN